MKFSTFSKMLVVLAVLLVSIMSVSAAFTVDATVDAANNNKHSDTTLTCKYDVTGDPNTYESFTVEWYKGTALQSQYTHQELNKVDGSYSSVGPTGILEMNPNEQWYCKATVTDQGVSVSDQSVSVLIVNYAPTLSFTQLGTLDVIEDSTPVALNLQSFADDKDLSADEKASGLTFTVVYEDTAKMDCGISADGTSFTYKPAADYFGTAKCKIQVKDAFNGLAQADVNFDVEGAPDEFKINSIADQSAVAGKQMEVEFSVVNPDKLNVQYSLMNAPNGMTVVALPNNKGKITFTPADDTDFASIAVKATANGLDYFEEFSLSVSNPTEPTLTSKSTSVEYATTFSLNLNTMLANPSNLPVTFEITSKPNTMSVGSEGTNSNNKLTWIPTEADKGDHVINVKAVYTISGVQKETATVTLKVRVKGPSCIEIKDMDVYVGPNSDDLDSDSGVDKDGGDFDAQPGDFVKLNVEIENICDKDDVNDLDHEVEDIEVTVTLEEIGSEDEQDQDESYKDLEVGEEDNMDFTFDIADDADSATYTMTIEAVGYDKDTGDLYEIDTVTIDVVVDKEDHKLKFNTFTLNPSTISCTYNAQLTVKVVNIGSNDEEDVELIISNSDLGIEEIELIDELQEGDSDDSDSYFKKTFNLQIPSDAPLGSYVLSGKVYYDDGDEDEAVSAILNIVGCGTTTTTTTTSENTDEGEETVEVVTTAAPVTTSQQTATATTDSDDTGSESFFDSSVYVGFLIAAIIVVLLVIVGLIVAISRK